MTHVAVRTHGDKEKKGLVVLLHSEPFVYGVDDSRELRRKVNITYSGERTVIFGQLGKSGVSLLIE